MTTREDRPGDEESTGAGDQRAGGSASSLDEFPNADLVQRADKVVRRALKAGVTGRDVEELVSWVAQRRVLLRRREARAAVEAVLAEIREAS